MPTPQNHPFSEVLSQAIRARGLSLERIRSRLDAAGVPVSIATLSYWQSGRSLPTRSRSYHTLLELEKVLNLEPGHLTQHTHTADGRTRRDAFAWETVTPVAELTTQIVDEMGIDMQGQLTRVVTGDELHLGPDRTEVRQVSRSVWRAERHGMHRWPHVMELEHANETLPRVEALFGCTVGEVVEVPERNLVVTELVANQACQRGDLFNVATCTHFAPSSRPATTMQRAISEPQRILALNVRFSPGVAPHHVTARYSPTVDTAPETVGEPEVVNDQVQWVIAEATPGIYALSWEWD